METTNILRDLEDLTIEFLDTLILIRFTLM